MKEFKQSILVVCLNEKQGQEIAHSLADELSMLYADSKNIVEYEVFDTQAVIEKCGIEYFEKREKSALKHISRYANAVVFVNYEYFNKGFDFFKNTCNLVYVKAKKRQLLSDDNINMLAYEERDKELEEKCEFIVPLKNNLKKSVEEIIKQFRSAK